MIRRLPSRGFVQGFRLMRCASSLLAVLSCVDEYEYGGVGAQHCGPYRRVCGHRGAL